MLKREVNLRRIKWINESERALNASCPHWLMWWLDRQSSVGRWQLLFVKIVLRAYGLEKIDVEKPGVGGLCLITKRGRIVKKVEYEWPDVDDAIFGKPQTIGGRGSEVQMLGGQADLGII